MDWTDHYVGAESRLRFLRIAMRVDAFRAEHGAFPKSLDELTWRIPESIATDPYRGESIRYRAVENGYRLYSVGENLKDDGGLYNLDGVVELIRETPPAPTKTAEPKVHPKVRPMGGRGTKNPQTRRHTTSTPAAAGL
jgi:hypothetical protein